MESCEGMGIRCLLAVTAGTQEPGEPHPSGGDKKCRQKGRGALASQCNLHKGALWPPSDPECCRTVQRSGCMLPPTLGENPLLGGICCQRQETQWINRLFRKFIGSS